MNTPLGRCPICAEPLEQEGDFLKCPAGDYRVKASRFNDRWKRFDRERKALKEAGVDGIPDAEELLRDLQEMKERGRKK